MKEFFKLTIFIDVRCIFCLEQHDITMVDGNQNHQLMDQSENLKSQAHPSFVNIIMATHNVMCVK